MLPNWSQWMKVSGSLLWRLIHWVSILKLIVINNVLLTICFCKVREDEFDGDKNLLVFVIGMSSSILWIISGWYNNLAIVNCFAGVFAGFCIWLQCYFDPEMYGKCNEFGGRITRFRKRVYIFASTKRIQNEQTTA